MDKWELKKHYEQQRKRKAKLDALDESIQRLRSRLQSASISHLTDEPRTNKTMDNIDRLLVLIEYENDYNKTWDESIDSEARVREAISSLDDPLEHAIMHHRYINCLEWETIKERLENKEMYYALGYLYEVHGNALKKLREQKEALLIE